MDQSDMCAAPASAPRRTAHRVVHILGTLTTHLRRLGHYKRELCLAGVLVAVVACLAVPRTGRPAAVPDLLAGEALVEASEARRTARLRALHSRLTERAEGKRQVAQALADGAVDLPTAAQRLRELTDGDPLTLQGLRDRFAGATSEEELFCRHAIDCVAALKWDSPAAAAATTARLQAELRSYLAARAVAAPNEPPTGEAG
jgi:hypothetical protein